MDQNLQSVNSLGLDLLCQLDVINQGGMMSHRKKSAGPYAVIHLTYLLWNCLKKRKITELCMSFISVHISRG